METWEKPIPSSHHRRHPSFSSSLLDQIYRSIDDSSPASLDSTRNKKHHHHHHHRHEVSPADHRRSVAADFERSMRRSTTATDFLIHSNSSSSDSSGGAFSSSESDSFYGRSKSSASPPPPSSTRQQPKPIRTSTVDHSSPLQKPKELGGFLRTKSKALKIYSDLKKVKQPISPGGRLATFLNSLFTNAAAANPKKQRKKTTSPVRVGETVHSSSTTCSSASSFSRSCLSKTPSSSGKSKRSVRFCPVNVILDEDSSTIPMPYTYNNRLYGSNEDKRDVMEEHRRVIQAAKDLLRTYHNKNKVTTTYDEDIKYIANVEEDEDDDAASCASSDLFELENLSAIGIERYREELPVYETTRLDNMNRAIATGLTV
ncbi:hypothetical protein CARUB_v10016082mg [Capsella rubella]|uniref:Protein BIG GRAIN 1-like B n=1 Tax=Capsella rubella TaxID=81985 RepID=R0GAN6_9BRAS|nr:protein BIG GRAIN 1-like A [Capsella rubella]EOA32772.1 hypothetical protein CARUB_v10016082mg [Capsella rubella]